MSEPLLPLAVGAAAVTALMAEPDPYHNNIQSDAYVVPFVGGYNVFGDNDTSSQKKTPVVGGEYRFPAWYYGLRPVLGGMVNFKGDVYGYGGLQVDVPLYEDKIWFIPGAAAGAFGHGDGRDLGGVIEFRTSMELAYQMENNHRLGVAIWHLSNADIYDDNPGTEAITVHYSIPVSYFGW